MALPALNQPNGIIKNLTIFVTLKYLSNFYRLLEISLSNCKVELTPRWTKHCVLSIVGAANASDDGTNSDNINFARIDTKLCVPIFTLSAKNNQKLSKLYTKGFER